MEGVTILNEISPNYGAAMVAAFLIVVAAPTTLVYGSFLFGFKKAFLCSCALFISVAVLLNIDKTISKKRYEVTIGNTVCFQDFFEHYEIINQKGKIFTVIERTE